MHVHGLNAFRPCDDFARAGGVDACVAGHEAALPGATASPALHCDVIRSDERDHVPAPERRCECRGREPVHHDAHTLQDHGAKRGGRGRSRGGFVQSQHHLARGPRSGAPNRGTDAWLARRNEFALYRGSAAS
jgi:hypothetical protein